jgi:hypothetical protein
MSEHGSNCSIEEIGTEELEEGLASTEATPEVPVQQCFGSGSKSGSALEPHSMGSWIRIHIANADPDPEE